MDGITGLFSTFGLNAQTKLLVLDSPVLPEGIASQARSLNQLEHVSPTGLMRREISRRRSDRNSRADDETLAVMRRWFFARKPDAGFVLTDFPATLLQARVFDEWMEARGETLDAVLAGRGHPVAEHYRSLGLLETWGAGTASASPRQVS